MAKLWISRSEEKHPKFHTFRAVYGFGIFTPCIRETDAIQKMPAAAAAADSDACRDVHRVINLPMRSWAWRLDCEETFRQLPCTFHDIIALTQCKWDWLVGWAVDRLHDLRLCTAHQGLHKTLTARLGDDPRRVQVTFDISGDMWPIVGDESVMPLVGDRLRPLVESAWNAKDDAEIRGIVEAAMPDDPCQQLAFCFVFAGNSAILKAIRNEIHYE
jgi:hypothetical protein